MRRALAAAAALATAGLVPRARADAPATCVERGPAAARAPAPRRAEEAAAAASAAAQARRADDAEKARRRETDERAARRDALRRAVTDAYEAELGKVEAQERAERGEAIARFEAFVSRYPDDPAYTPDALFRLSELYYERAADEYAAALAAWRDDARRVPAGAEPPPEPVKSFAKAIALYQRMLTGFPNYPHLHAAQYLLGYCLGEMGQGEEAKRAYEVLVERFPTSAFVPEAWVRLGDAAFDDPRPGSLERAIEAYRKVDAWPDHRLHPRALYKLGWTYYRMDRFGDAVDAFTRLLDHDVAAGAAGRGDMWPEAVQYVGVSFADPSFGGPERAKAFFAARGGRPYEREIYARLGEVLLEETRHADAVKAFELAVAADPLSPDAPRAAAKVVLAFSRERRFDDEVKEREAIVLRYGEGSAWWAKNGADPVLAAEVQDLVEKCLARAAAYHHERAQVQAASGRDDLARPEYAAAARLYGDSLARFPAGRDAHAFAYARADALYHAGDLVGAAAAYAAVRDDPRDAAHEAEAALSAVVAWSAAIADAERGGALPARRVLTSKERTTPPGSPAPLEPLLAGLVRDSDAFVARFPSHEKAPAAAYKAAELYYAHDDFAEARCRFEEIVARWPSSEVAGFAANLVIESHLAVKDWAAVEAASARLQASEAAKAPALRATLQDFKLGGRFNRALALMEAKRWDEAAELFTALVAEDPRHAFADKALYNAATCHEGARRFESALRLHERIFAEYPGSTFADEALFRVAWNAESSYDFEKAVERYLLLVERYPRSARRKDALYDAARALENLQRYAEAARAFARYAEAYPDAPDAAKTLFHAALVHEKAGAVGREAEALSDLVRRFARSGEGDLVVQAQLKLARAERALGDERAARAAFEAAVAEFARRKLDPGAAPLAAAAAAEARFELAEYEFARFDAMKLPPTSNPKKLGKALEAKLAELKRLAPAYDEVKRYRRPDWILAAFYRQAALLERLAQTLYEAPVPPELQAPGQEEYLAAYQDQLAQFAQPYEDQAVQIHAQALQAARELHVKNAWTRRTAEALARYRPKEYPLLKEPKVRMLAHDLSPLPLVASPDGPATAERQAAGEGTK
ncbi:MAG: tetratricopeptide repeat protein [Anaeromyxobacteraceae bacterium]